MSDMRLTRKISAVVYVDELVDKIETIINESEIENEEGCSDFVDSYPDEEVARVMIAVGEELIKRYRKES